MISLQNISFSLIIDYNLIKSTSFCNLQHRDTQETLAVLDRLDLDSEKPSDEELARKFGFEEDYFKGTVSWWQRLKPQLWSLFDEPYSSNAAKVIILGILFLFVFFVVMYISVCLAEPFSTSRRWLVVSRIVSGSLGDHIHCELLINQMRGYQWRQDLNLGVSPLVWLSDDALSETDFAY